MKSNNAMLQKILLSLCALLMVSVDFYAQTKPYEKFLGVWNRTSTHIQNGTYGNIKIIETDGDIYVLIKTSNEGIKRCKATYNSQNDGIEWGWVDQINKGSWKLGAWERNGYRDKKYNWNKIVITSSGGSNGDATWKTPGYRQGQVATEEVEYIRFRAYIKGDQMDVYYQLGSDYGNDGVCLFSQTASMYIYDTYTNW